MNAIIFRRMSHVRCGKVFPFREISMGLVSDACVATHARLLLPYPYQWIGNSPRPKYSVVREMNISACWLLSNGISRGQKESPTLQSWNRISEAGLDDERPEKTEKFHGDSFMLTNESMRSFLLR